MHTKCRNTEQNGEAQGSKETHLSSNSHFGNDGESSTTFQQMSYLWTVVALIIGPLILTYMQGHINHNVNLSHISLDYQEVCARV